MAPPKKPLSAEEKAQRDAESIRRVKLPRGNQSIGLLTARLGGSRCRVQCADGQERICRIPGRLKRSLWVREGDTVLVEPWEFGGDEKGDIIFKYRPVQAKWLKKKGYLDTIEENDEF